MYNYAECVQSYRSSCTGNIVALTDGSDRIAVIRSRLLYLYKYHGTGRLPIWTAKQILGSYTTVEVFGSPERAVEPAKVYGD